MMRAHQELTIFGPTEELKALPGVIETRLSDGWSRNRAQEADLRPNSTADLYCFHRDTKPPRPAADLWLSLNDGELRVSNIVPSYGRYLSYGDYNEILNEFADKYLFPAARDLGLRVLLTGANLDIRALLSPSVAEALVEFSRNANKMTRASHPRDKERWESFVIAAHRAGAELDSATLRRWLIEEEHWPPDAADDLSIEYDQARSILEEYDRRTQSA